MLPFSTRDWDLWPDYISHDACWPGTLVMHPLPTPPERTESDALWSVAVSQGVHLLEENRSKRHQDYNSPEAELHHFELKYFGFRHCKETLKFSTLLQCILLCGNFLYKMQFWSALLLLLCRWNSDACGKCDCAGVPAFYSFRAATHEYR